MPPCAQQRRRLQQQRAARWAAGRRTAHGIGRHAAQCQAQAAATDIRSQALAFTANAGNIEEQAALHMLASYRSAETEVAGLPGKLQTRYIGPQLAGSPGSTSAAKLDTPILLVHSFDSSAVEWRRTYPRLAERADVYAVDLLGAGFTDVCMYAEDPSLPLGPDQVCSQLHSFWQRQIGRPVAIVGASLGGTAVLDFALRHPEAVSKVVLIDAQGYIDGLGPAAKGPTWLTKLGVRFLRTVFLRSMANKTAYFDAKLATDDAMRIGRVHTFEPGWLEAKVAFIKSGGYKGLSRRVRDISQQVLLMWGRQDKVLDVKYVKEFERDLKHVDTLLMDECGHMAHLEQSKACADAILDFTGK